MSVLAGMSARNAAGCASTLILRFETMSVLTYLKGGRRMADKPLVWLEGEIATPPFSDAARVETGYLLRRLQMGEKLSMPHSEPMTTIGSRCHSLRIKDGNAEWRIVYRIDDDAI